MNFKFKQVYYYFYKNEKNTTTKILFNQNNFTVFYRFKLKKNHSLREQPSYNKKSQFK